MGEVYTTPSFDRLKSIQRPQISVSASVTESVLKLDVSSAELSNAEISELLKSYRQKTKYHLLSSGALINVEKLDFDNLDKIATDLDLTQKDIKKGEIQLPKYRAFYLDLQKGISGDKSFKEYINSLKTIERKRANVPQTLANTLRPYQIKGFRWLCSRAQAGFGGILADEMGLGKSLQLITLFLHKRKEGTAPNLIICPSSLVYNWKAEFERFAPEMNVLTVAGNAQNRKNAIEETFQNWEDKSKNHIDVLITSYDLARIDIENYCDKNFFFMTLDEAQYIKNHNTQTTKAIKLISAEHKFALTGTPIENRLSELWSIFDFLMPGILGSKTHFKVNFEKPIANGDEEAQKRLQTLIGPFMLRRCKSEVLKDLPEKLESVVYTEMGEEQKKLYQAFEKRLALQLQNNKGKKNKAKPQEMGEMSQVQVLAELTKLRQLCCDPRLLLQDVKEPGCKLETIQELINTSIDAGEKTLIFSQFTSYLDLIANNLEANNIEYYTITGKTPKQKRLSLVNAFNEDEVPVFLISLKAGGTGLNLTGASVVIHADPWWNDAAQQQASDRAHRIGQTRVVNVLKVIAKDTIEERIVKLQESKRQLSEEFVKSGTVSMSSLSEQDLLELLGS